MQHSDLSPIRHTSVTIRSACRSRLKRGAALLKSRGFRFSEQRLMRECLRIALRFWRGHRSKACRNRRYNRKIGVYEVVPFYTTESLRAVAWVRCHHSGISLSRLMDFAVNHYLDRVLEQWLSGAYSHRDAEDVGFWKAKYEKRRQKSEFIISYAVETQKHTKDALSYGEKTEFLPWPPIFQPPRLHIST